MAYPTFGELAEAMQSGLDRALVDPLLRGGTLVTLPSGQPLVRGGTWALTFEIETDTGRYALRCFHKELDSAKVRYAAIERCLAHIESPHFLGVRYQARGIRTESGHFPVVRMAWADGPSLAAHIAAHRHDPAELQRLRESLRRLAAHLHAHGLAHGDLQPSNLIVQPGGLLRLIDYDGMFVPELAGRSAAELGQRNFQHPERRSRHFDAGLDAFAFLVLDLALDALATHPELWNLTASGEDAVILRAADHADPASSPVFKLLAGDPRLEARVRSLAAVCRQPFSQVPTLEAFLAGSVPPDRSLRFASTAGVAGAYLAPNPIVDGADFAQCCRHEGDRVELLGRVLRVEDSPQLGDAGERWLRIEFGSAGVDGVCLRVLPGARQGMDGGPDAGWTGAWVSALGLVEPVQTDNRHALPRKYVAITISDPSQLRTLGEAEARRRLRTRVEWLGRVGAAGAAVRTEPAIADGAPVAVTVQVPAAASVNLPTSRRVTAPAHRHESTPESEPNSREPLLEIIDESALEPSELVPLPMPLPRRRAPLRPAIVIAAISVVLAGLVLLAWRFGERRAARNEETARIAAEPLRPLRIYVQRLPPVLESQRVLDTSTGGAVNTVAGPLAVREGNGENCRYGLVLGESPVDGLCEDRIELAHLAVYSDRDVVVGFVRCEADDEPCGRRRPFWLELRAGKPPTLRRTVKVWAGADPGPVRATSEHTQVDLGVWDGERRIVALTTSGYLVVERAPAPPKPLDRADCSLVARVLESCADSRDCGSFEASARQIRDAHWTRMQLIYHESTGFDVAAFRRLCVRACELGLTPSYSLIRRYACSGSVPGQWTGAGEDQAPTLAR